MQKSKRSIAVMNQKGGVGKTTTVVNLGAALAGAGQRVCLIDLDPQAHTSMHLKLDPDPEQPSIYDALAGKVSLAEIRRQVAENLWAIGSNLDLAAAEIELSGVVGREQILRDKLAEDSTSFDYLLIDCPPSLGILTLNALAAVDEVFIPLQPHFLALHGLSKLLDTIELVAARLADAVLEGKAEQKTSAKAAAEGGDAPAEGEQAAGKPKAKRPAPKPPKT